MLRYLAVAALLPLVVVIPEPAGAADFEQGGNQLVGRCDRNDAAYVLRWQTVAGPDRSSRSLEGSYRTVVEPSWVCVFPGVCYAADFEVTLEDRYTGGVLLSGRAVAMRWGSGPAVAWARWTGGSLYGELAALEGSMAFGTYGASMAFELR